LQDQLVIIDVSQAVDLDHPKALDFLREDCAHVNDFFRRGGVAVLTNRELFDFAVDPNINDSNEAAVLEELQQRAARWASVAAQCTCTSAVLLCMQGIVQLNQPLQ
jgi:serine/threonine-protein kinase RIO1